MHTPRCYLLIYWNAPFLLLCQRSGTAFDYYYTTTSTTRYTKRLSSFLLLLYFIISSQVAHLYPLFFIYIFFFRVIFVESYISPLLCRFFSLRYSYRTEIFLVNDWSFLYVYFFRVFRFKSGLNPFTFYKTHNSIRFHCVSLSILDLQFIHQIFAS